MKNIILIFDTETSGFYHWRKSLDEQPHILQFSYILYDTERKRIVKRVSSYVRVDENIVIPEEVVKINGCTRELCDSGKPIQSLLTEFYYDFHLAEFIVAHNLEFDSNMIQIEFKRHLKELEDICPHGTELFVSAYLKSVNIQLICTMKETTQIVKAIHKNPKIEDDKNKNYKWPTLAELHKHCFGSVPDNLHNAMMDVLVTLRCFMYYKYHVSMTDEQFDWMISKEMGGGKIAESSESSESSELNELSELNEFGEME